MNKYFILVPLILLSCSHKEIVITKTRLPLARKAYADLSEKAYDSVSKLNPHLKDRYLEDSGLIQEGRLLTEKFELGGSDIELCSKNDAIKIECGKRTEAFKLILSANGDSKEILTGSPDTRFCLVDVIPGGFKEIVTLDVEYIMNGENFSVTIYEVR